MEEKNLGQHFLINEGVLEKEVDIAKISKIDRVIEIGTGNGKLTEKILKKTKEVVSFEIDKSLYEKIPKDVLEKTVFGDAMKHSWKGYNKIVANIPYYLSERIIRKAIREEIEEMVLVVGEKFKKILEEGIGEIGFISNLFFEAQFVEKIPANYFDPPPRTDSWLIKLKKKEGSGVEKKLQRIYIRNGKVKNAFLSEIILIGKTKREGKEIIENSGVSVEELNARTRNIKRETIEKIKKVLTEHELE